MKFRSPVNRQPKPVVSAFELRRHQQGTGAKDLSASRIPRDAGRGATAGGKAYREFSDPRLVAIYDAANPIAGYEAFYVGLAARLSASSIIDIGCGTGLLTCALARRGHRMTGVEPSAAMLDRARHRRDGTHVNWIGGDMASLTETRADLAIMTGHVAQFFLDDTSWHAALSAIHAALGPGGHIAFESRNPLAQPWATAGTAGHADWPSHAARRRVDDPVAGPVEWWVQSLEANGERARYQIHYRFEVSGEELVSVNELRFRTKQGLGQSLSRAGFAVQDIYGDWDGQPVGDASPELIFVAARL